MKVVVYFRQAGGTVAGTYPLITHWAEDEDEQPVPLFSQFDMEAMADAAPEILVQLQSANRWLKEKRGVVVASFTETEDGSGRRPSYGAARKTASRERATILIATTKALAGQRFAPISQDGLEVIRLKDPEDAASESWARARNVVLYLRTATSPDDARTLLEKQRGEIRKMLRSANVLAEFVETEPLRSAERPQLQQALALCREQKARLFIGTTDAILEFKAVSRDSFLVDGKRFDRCGSDASIDTQIPTTAELVKLAIEANADCRGLGSPESDIACAKRDLLDGFLYKRGMCSTEPDWPASEEIWHVCHDILRKTE